VLETLFWLSLGMIAYTYVGYAILLKLMPKAPRPEIEGSFAPPVSIIIAAYKGAGAIKAKLDNTLASNYPAKNIEIIVIADGSEDGTDDIVAAYGDPRVSLIRQIPRAGKTAAQKKGVAKAQHEILIFTDLTTMLEPNSITELVKNLEDPTIGLVSSEDIWVTSDGTITESAQGAYVKYEMWLRDSESAISSIVSASGCFYAVRKMFFEPIPDYLIDDTVIPLTVAERGFRCIHNHTARSLVPMIPSAGREFSRRARMTLGGINALMYKKQLLNPFRFGFYSVQLWSHKMFRWLVPFAMIAALAANIGLAIPHPVGFWGVALLAHLALYAIALTGFARRNAASTHKLIRLTYFFVSSNLALLLSWYQYFTSGKQTTWSESRG
jgi:cellulose synthase/poly-beta-1,6-N-acetylglucosamine synthase-like glycosyltransferase